MRIIPAIDIINGQCVRLVQGDYSKKTTYSDEPVKMAVEFESNGITDLHLVDLDGAKSGGVVNINILEEICSSTNLNVDFGGGIKSEKDLESAFRAGAKQVTVGSLAVKNPELVKSWVAKYGAQKIILGADVNGLKIAINGWKQTTEIDVFQFIKDYTEVGVQSVICTDIATDGMLQGPSFELYSKIISQFPNIKLIASGGVTTVEDLDRLIEIGVEGAIVGKALYEGSIDVNNLIPYVS